MAPEARSGEAPDDQRHRCARSGAMNVDRIDPDQIPMITDVDLAREPARTPAHGAPSWVQRLGPSASRSPSSAVTRRAAWIVAEYPVDASSRAASTERCSRWLHPTLLVVSCGPWRSLSPSTSATSPPVRG
jgi:hypothetical protein